MSRYNKNTKKMKAEFHCPVSGCWFAEGSARHFTEKKFLNQHIAKVHAEKKYSCAKCEKSFGMDWWRKHHEKTCGIMWKCDCGVQYASRETLLTHVRRTQHKLPDYVILKDKMKQSKASPKLNDNPVIILIQPVIQNITCTQLPPTSVLELSSQRRILPKTTKPSFTLPLPRCVPAPVSTINTSPVILEQTNENILYKSVQSLISSQMPMQSTATKDICTDTSINEITPLQSSKVHSTVATQTIDDAVVSSNRRQSQASQCSRRKPKSLKVGIESHTQTAESAVIKKKKSRRKSVAITTETNMLTDQMLGPDTLFWPGFKDFVLQHADSLGARLFKNSASTQTSVITNSKTLCDSETITDNELLKFAWEEPTKVIKDGKSNSQFHMITNIATNNALGIDLDSHNLQELNMFADPTLDNFTEAKAPCQALSDSLNGFTSVMAGTHIGNGPGAITNTGNCPDAVTETLNNSTTCTNTGISSSDAYKNTSDENCSMFSVFGNCDKSSKISSAPTLSDIHTQTIASVLDYNLLTNMETQTTDDFNFAYLEFSDTETQTPWEDFPSIDDSPMKTDQLSIEIQTDFSSFDPGHNLDPYELINSVDVQNMVAGCSSKESAGVNTETQTLDKFYFPQFTNSESQTLDISDFMFDS